MSEERLLIDNEVVTTVSSELIKNHFYKFDVEQNALVLDFDKNVVSSTEIYQNNKQKYSSGFSALEENKLCKQTNFLEEFVELISHDVKPPIIAKKNALKLLFEGNFGELNPEQKEIIEELLNSSCFMLEMLENVVSRYKIANNDFSITKTRNSIKAALENSVLNVSYKLKHKNQIIKITSKIDDNVILNFDEQKIVKAFTNILSNAIDVSPRNSEIVVSVENKHENITISVKDFGKGISKDIIEALQKGQCPKSKKFKKIGSGFGLFVIQKIIDAHGWFFDVQTGERGTTFCIVIPTFLSKNVLHIH